MLIAFDMIYFIWGLRKSIKNKPHTHWHTHINGNAHIHTHQHLREHSHIHGEQSRKLTPWVLFIIFVFGPCEALIPLLMYPAATSSYSELIAVVTAFSVTTIITMLFAVMIPVSGLRSMKLHSLERSGHTSAGVLIFLSGIRIQFLGL